MLKFLIYCAFILISSGPDSNTISESPYIIEVQDTVLKHAVYIWLKDDLSTSEKDLFLEKAKALGSIKSVKTLEISKPANTATRSVTQNDFSYYMEFIFNSVESHDAYQIDVIHKDFVETCKGFWDKVVVYDSVTP